jgi:hypothetical protein
MKEPLRRLATQTDVSYRAVKKLGPNPYHVCVIQKLQELAKDKIALLSTVLCLYAF